MKTYQMLVTTSFTKVIEVEADDKYDARDKAWNWIEEHDALHNADIDTEVTFNGEITND